LRFKSLCDTKSIHEDVIIGAAALMRRWRRNEEFRVAAMKAIGFIRSRASAILIAGATATAGGILEVDALSVLTD